MTEIEQQLDILRGKLKELPQAENVPYTSTFSRVSPGLYYDEINCWMLQRNPVTGAWSNFRLPSIWLQIKSEFCREMRYHFNSFDNLLGGWG